MLHGWTFKIAYTPSKVNYENEETAKNQQQRAGHGGSAAASVQNIAALAASGYRTPDEQVAELMGLQVETVQQPATPQMLPPAERTTRKQMATKKNPSHEPGSTDRCLSAERSGYRMQTLGPYRLHKGAARTFKIAYSQSKVNPKSNKLRKISSNAPDSGSVTASVQNIATLAASAAFERALNARTRIRRIYGKLIRQKSAYHKQAIGTMK